MDDADMCLDARRRGDGQASSCVRPAPPCSAHLSMPRTHQAMQKEGHRPTCRIGSTASCIAAASATKPARIRIPPSWRCLPCSEP